MASKPDRYLEEMRRRVTQVFPNLVTDLEPDQLSYYFIGQDIISVEQWHEIKAQQSTKEGRCCELLVLLMKLTDPRAMDAFVDALKQNDEWKWIVEQVKSEEPSAAHCDEFEDAANLTQDMLLKIMKKLEDMDGRIKQLEDENKCVKKKNQELEAKLKENEATWKKAMLSKDRHIAELGEEIKSLSDENQQMKAQLKEQEINSDNLKFVIDLREARIIQLEEEIKILKEEVPQSKPGPDGKKAKWFKELRCILNLFRKRKKNQRHDV